MRLRLRVQPVDVAWATGHAAGVLAALSASGGQADDARWVADARRILADQGALL